jgi:O-antigen/teichoic acid export membrane protein
VTIRRHLARGMLTNGIFQILMLGLTAARGLAAAAFVTRSDYGIWGLIGLSMWTALGLKSQFGAGEKYVQQSDENQEHAFQRAFTIEVIFACAMVPVATAATLVLASVSGNAKVLAPSLLLLLLLPATALQFPISVFYRRLQFRRQRILQAVDPVVGASVTVALAILGAGYWSFVIGALCGAWSLALVVLRFTPYRLAFRYERGTLRSYLSFSTPLLVSGIATLALFYVIYLVGNAALGVAGIGAFTLAGNLVQFTDQADIITATLYPAVCVVQDRIALLSEIFVKSNRLSLMWAAPFGVGMALFASDLVRLVLGSRWLPAIPVLEIIGVVTAVNHVGYNWAAFVKARGTTWPIAVGALVNVGILIGAGIPLMYAEKLVGLGLAFALGGVGVLVVRGIWMRRFFLGVSLVRQLLRAFMPTALAVLPVLALRAGLGVEHNLAAAGAVLALYVAVTLAATARLEGPLLREALGYMVSRAKPAAGPSSAAAGDLPAPVGGVEAITAGA